MSGRKLGGGRILGNGKGLAPPAPPAVKHRERAASPSAPSIDSTLSNGSPAESSISPGTSSPLPGFAQDLTSNISLGGPSNGGHAGSKLVCPICDEEMLTLLQLNRHIDDNHQELPEFEQDEVKSWIDKQVLKAKRFQPLSLINQKLRGLEVFESNETTPPPPPTTGRINKPALPELPTDPEDLITKAHWQRQGPNDLCTDPACGKRLGAVNGNVNCRQCGRLFCEEHTMYQMKLSRSAAHEPVRGYWYRVCETCYKSREGYNDHNGLMRDHTKEFAAIRRKRVDRQTLEISRLEKRLTKLTQLLASPPEEAGASGSGGLLSPVASLGAQKNHRKALEQTVVTWEDDAKVEKCPFCRQEFGSWTFRRHHCRICGRVVCADPQTGCSSEVGLNVAHPTAPSSEKPLGGEMIDQISVDIRMCQDCKTTIFAKRDFAESVMHKPRDQRAYETLKQFERGIQQLLPTFQRALVPLQDENNPPTHAQIQEAAKIRKRLTDSFTKYDVAARRIRDMKTDSPTQRQLQKAIYAAGSSFLHMHMLPLKNLPRMLKHSNSAMRNRHLLPTANGHAAAGSPLRHDSFDTASQTSEASTVVSALETEEKELRERLIVLEEQRYMVQKMISGARGARRFEEVSALTRNVEELEREIESLQNKVEGVEERWQGLYANGAPPVGSV
ncbi:FYVE zinc finger protein [Xylariaceae sp. FL0662B]|nr:FYVE zinc finger protein [Xylariaceae sp. FL0662B]